MIRYMLDTNMIAYAKNRLLPFDSAAAFDYGEIRHYLKARGIIISGNDMLIAAHARSLGITLVTHNTREFSRVQNLMLEDWVI